MNTGSFCIPAQSFEPPRTAARRRSGAGFTLIEMMITIAVAATLLGLAAPSLSDFIHSSRLATQSNDLLAALNLARVEALRRGQNVVFCRSANPVTTCGGGAGNWQGWLVFVDANRNRQLDAGEAVLRSGTIDPQAPQVQASAALVAQANSVAFGPRGFALTQAGNQPLTAALSVCKPNTSMQDNARTLFIVAGSRMAVVKTDDAACAAPPDTQPT